MDEAAAVRKARVFVVQEPCTMVRGEWRPKYDLSAAEQFGELVRMLEPGNVPEDPRSSYRRLTAALADFDAEVDYLLLLGDPVAIGRAVLCLAGASDADEFKALKWDARANQYVVYRI